MHFPTGGGCVSLQRVAFPVRKSHIFPAMLPTLCDWNNVVDARVPIAAYHRAVPHDIVFIAFIGVFCLPSSIIMSLFSSYSIVIAFHNSLIKNNKRETDKAFGFSGATLSRMLKLFNYNSSHLIDLVSFGLPVRLSMAISTQ